jgi:glutamyl-tRNA synthetase
MKDFEKKVRAYALKNALAHEGKAIQGAVISALFNEGLAQSDLKKYGKEISKIVSEVNNLKPKEQETEFIKLHDFVHIRESREGLPELPNAKKGVVMRFGPAPSGPLHIGHVISNMTQSLYIKKYGGKFYIRIEDTNPERVLPEAYEGIKKDCDWLFDNIYDYVIQSDRMEIYYKYAEKLVNQKSAYVCTCSPEKFKQFAAQMTECPCRNNPLSENLLKWKKMLDKNSKKNYKVGEAVLRFKTPEKFGGIKNKNPAMRDFPLARINEHEHPRQKDKYRVWPLMNLAVTVDDIEYKMTHIIRGKDHKDNAERQKMIYYILGLEKKFPWTYFIGRIKFTDLAISKRKITAAIEAGEFEGWEDERLPTVASLRKRGYKPETFAKFAEQRGLTEVDKVISSKDFFKVLNDIQKKIS